MRAVGSQRAISRPIRVQVMGTSRFSREEVPHVLRACDRAGPPEDSRYRPRVVLPSASVNGVGSPDFLFSRLNTEPMRAPVNASSPTSRSSAHDSGSAASPVSLVPVPMAGYTRRQLARNLTRPAQYGGLYRQPHRPTLTERGAAIAPTRRPNPEPELVRVGLYAVQEPSRSTFTR